MTTLPSSPYTVYVQLFLTIVITCSPFLLRIGAVETPSSLSALYHLTLQSQTPHMDQGNH